MATAVIRIEAPPTGIEVTDEGSGPTDEQMAEEQAARQRFLDELEPKLAELPKRAPTRSGNVTSVELLGGVVWSELNQYLLLMEVDIGDPRVDWDELVGPGGSASIIGQYSAIGSWPEGGSPA